MSHTQHNRPAAHSGNRARAIWKGGALPEEHRWAWQLVVTVEQPEFGIILDCGKVRWKGTVRQVDQSALDRRTPTWKPRTGKSLICVIPLPGSGKEWAHPDSSWTDHGWFGYPCRSTVHDDRSPGRSGQGGGHAAISGLGQCCRRPPGRLLDGLSAPCLSSAIVPKMAFLHLAANLQRRCPV